MNYDHVGSSQSAKYRIIRTQLDVTEILSGNSPRDLWPGAAPSLNDMYHLKLLGRFLKGVVTLRPSQMPRQPMA